MNASNALESPQEGTAFLSFLLLDVTPPNRRVDKTHDLLARIYTEGTFRPEGFDVVPAKLDGTWVMLQIPDVTGRVYHWAVDIHGQVIYCGPADAPIANRYTAELAVALKAQPYWQQARLHHSALCWQEDGPDAVARH